MKSSIEFLKTWFGVCAAGMAAGCSQGLPFRHTITPIIPTELRSEGERVTPNSFNYPYAKAYAINDVGHVVGIYNPPAPRRWSQIFIYADGKLSRHDYPCPGILYVVSVTNSRLIAGHCQPSVKSSREDATPYSFVVSYAEPGGLRNIQPAWPTKGFFVLGLNDRGDAIGWNPGGSIKSSEKEQIAGFAYVSGQLHMVHKSDIPDIHILRYAKINSTGFIIGGERKQRLVAGKFQEFNQYIFDNGKFVELPSGLSGWVAAINDSGHWVSKDFGLYDGKFSNINCGMEYCSAADINNLGWVVGSGHTSYPIPPMGASFGHSYLWIDGKFYNIDKSVGKKINFEYPLKISNKGHIILHSDGWPYLITPTNIPRKSDY